MTRPLAFSASRSTNSSWILRLDEQPAAGRAALAAVEVDGVERARDGRVEIGVGEDDVGALAAQLEGDVA